jgi:deoxyribonuclease V
MIACVDVHYGLLHATAACVQFTSWADAISCGHHVATINDIKPYVSGQFYRRELPCILEVIEPIKQSIETLLIDGHVWLGDQTTLGLGAWVYESLNRRVQVVGVAKKRFHGSKGAIEVCRGCSRRPLIITTAGIDVEIGAELIRRMHGRDRIPTLIKLADQLARANHENR